MLIHWQENEGNAHIERVVWSDPESDYLFVMNITDKHGFPRKLERVEILSVFESGDACVLEKDPYNYLHRPDTDIKDSLQTRQAERWKIMQERRDQRWAIIRPLVWDEDGRLNIDILFSNTRGSLVAKAAKETGIAVTTICDWLRLFFQRGMMPNALFPDYQRSGGPGKSKQAGTSKRGHPTRRRTIEDASTGINADPAVQRKLQLGYKKFYVNKSDNSLRKAFQETLEFYFCEGYEASGNVIVPRLPPKSQLPTLRQFKYWGLKVKDEVQTRRARKGSRRHNLSDRPILGDSTQMAFAAGSLVQMDACISNIHLVALTDPSNLVGRATIYFIIDVFSRLVVGVDVSLEGPSWLGAMLALESMTADKVKLCASYGIPISEEEWPSHHLCEKILADGGEMKWFNADMLVQALGVTIANAGSFRADMKGIVEQLIRLIKDELRAIPGAVKKHERGEKDARLDACVSLLTLREIVLRCVIKHNNFRWLDDYPLTKDMREDGVRPVPVELWNWSVANRGQPRVIDQDIMRLNLLPRGEATVTRQGIYYDHLWYTCDLAERDNWYVKAKSNGSWKVALAYDPRLVDFGYLPLNGNEGLEVCHLLPRSQSFQGCEWDEIHKHFAQKQDAREAFKEDEHQIEANFDAHVNAAVNADQERAAQAREGQSNRAQLANRHAKRVAEKTTERKANSWRLGDAQSTTQPEKDADPSLPPNHTEQARDKTAPLTRDINILRQVRKEKLQDGNE